MADFELKQTISNYREISTQHDELEPNWKKSSTETEYGVW